MTETTNGAAPTTGSRLVLFDEGATNAELRAECFRLRKELDRALDDLDLVRQMARREDQDDRPEALIAMVLVGLSGVVIGVSLALGFGGVG